MVAPDSLLPNIVITARLATHSPPTSLYNFIDHLNGGV